MTDAEIGKELREVADELRPLASRIRAVKADLAASGEVGATYYKVDDALRELEYVARDFTEESMRLC